MVHRGFEWGRGDVQEWMAERVPSFWVNPLYSFPHRGHQCHEHVEGEVSGDVHLVVSVSKAEPKPSACPI